MRDAPLFAGIGGHQSANSRTDEWLTPPEVINALGGANSFDLDPCSPVTRPWPTARRHYTELDNGLMQAWHGRVWLNPPYSSTVIGKWLARMAHHNEGVSLIFARTETDAFFRHVWDKASAVLFMRGRINFHYVDGRRAAANAGAPSVLCAYGTTNADILATCGIDGQFVPLRLPRFVIAAGIDRTWLEIISEWLGEQSGPVALADLYRQFANHPKARSNRNVDAKIRQVLQRGPFRRVTAGVWALEA
jgi:hypothetical protein